MQQHLNTYTLGASVTLRGLYGSSATEIMLGVLSGSALLRLKDPAGYGIGNEIVIDPEDEHVDEQGEVLTVTGDAVVLVQPLIYSHRQRAPIWRLVDPDTARLQILSPSGVITPFDSGGIGLTHDSLGRWSHRFTPDATGVWWYRWSGEGAIETAREKSFTVLPSMFD